jgi:hypothetical protein
MKICAIVAWFDRRDGEGVARSLDRQASYRISAAGIPGKKTWYSHTACVFYVEGQEIELEILDEPPYAKCLTQGTFDEAKWNSLDHDRLAFRCDENGKALCGLFATKRKDAV